MKLRAKDVLMTGLRYFLFIQITILLTMFAAPLLEGPLAGAIAGMMNDPKPAQTVVYILVPLLMEMGILFALMRYYEGTRKTRKEMLLSCLVAFAFHFAFAAVLQFNGVYAGVSIFYVVSLVTGIVDIYQVPFYINMLVFLVFCVFRFGTVVSGLFAATRKAK